MEEQPNAGPPNREDGVKLRQVYSTDDAATAELVRNALQAEGFMCEIDGETQGGFTGLTSMAIKLYVREEDHDKARAYINAHHTT